VDLAAVMGLVVENGKQDVVLAGDLFAAADHAVLRDGPSDGVFVEPRDKPLSFAEGRGDIPG
jgi:hypothetical protein